MDVQDFGIVSAGVSAGIAAISYWAKTRHEQRRATRTVLYYLLELHHAVHRVHRALENFEAEFIGELRKVLQTRSIPFDETPIKALLKQAAPAIADFGRLQVETTVSEIAEALDKSLADLAREDPVLAFRLRGRDQLLVITRRVAGFLDKISDEAIPLRDIAQIADSMGGLTLQELRSAIRATAWRCDVMTHARTLLVLRNAAKEGPEELREVLGLLIDKYVASAQANAVATDAIRS